MSKKEIGFALGGLAGNNFHGAGFLYAALKHSVKPDYISCTSGQIRWVYHYLQANGSADKFKKIYQKNLEFSRPNGNPNIDYFRVALSGFPGVFQPAYTKWALEAMVNGVEKMQESMESVLQQKTPMFLDNLYAFSTNRIADPLNDEIMLGEMERLFNQSEIGIVFNSYDPVAGIENIYLNPVAERKMEKIKKGKAPRHDQFGGHKAYMQIDEQGIKDALWLYMYGFRDSKTGHLDGAFFREMMLAELSVADVIFAVRPINYQWKGSLPNTFQATEDLKTEVSFNGSYVAERDQILLINKFIDEGLITTDKKKFHKIEIVPIEMQEQRGYFDYALESHEVFTAADGLASREIQNLKGNGTI